MTDPHSDDRKNVQCSGSECIVTKGKIVGAELKRSGVVYKRRKRDIKSARYDPGDMWSVRGFDWRGVMYTALLTAQD